MSDNTIERVRVLTGHTSPETAYEKAVTYDEGARQRISQKISAERENNADAVARDIAAAELRVAQRMIRDWEAQQDRGSRAQAGAPQASRGRTRPGRPRGSGFLAMLTPSSVRSRPPRKRRGQSPPSPAPPRRDRPDSTVRVSRSQPQIIMQQYRPPQSGQPSQNGDTTIPPPGGGGPA